MATVVYKLIDGAFFVRLLAEYGSMLNSDLQGAFAWNSLQAGAHRTIFYDALPVKKDSQSEAEFLAAEAEKLGFLDGLRSLPNMQVRDGLTRLRTKSNKSHISQVYEQKGVDTWIAVDAMRYSLNGVADEVHIYTSDADLYPVFEALQDTRCRGVLFYQFGRTSKELIHSADRAEPLRMINLISMTKDAHLFSPVSFRNPLNWPLVAKYDQSVIRAEIVRLDQKIGCNFFHRDEFTEAVEVCHPYILSDWLYSRGVSVAYADILEVIKQ